MITNNRVVVGPEVTSNMLVVSCGLTVADSLHSRVWGSLSARGPTYIAISCHYAVVPR